MPDVIHMQEVHEAVEKYDMPYDTAYYRVKKGIPLDMPYKRRNGNYKGASRTRPSGQPADCQIYNTHGRPGKCLSCKHYLTCLDYASSKLWQGWGIRP